MWLKLCKNNSTELDILQPTLVYTRSRLPNCAKCGIGSLTCQECVGQGMQWIDSLTCSNLEPMLELRIQISISTSASEMFRLLHFEDLNKLVVGALESKGAWDTNSTFQGDGGIMDSPRFH